LDFRTFHGDQSQKAADQDEYARRGRCDTLRIPTSVATAVHGGLRELTIRPSSRRLMCERGIPLPRLATFASPNTIPTGNHQSGVQYVPHHRSCVSSSRIHCIFGARLVPLRLAESAGRAAEGFVGRPCYGKFHGSFRQRSGGHLSGSSLRSGRARSRPSGRVPDVRELDHRLQSDHGLVWTLCQPDDRCHKRDRDIRRPQWSPDKGARHGNFPAHLSEVGWILAL
jgi:hypothetical protein